MEINQKHLLSGDNITLMNCSKNYDKFENNLPDTVVIHYTAGKTAESSAEYLCRPDIKASAHLVIGRDGEIYQLVPFDTISWHAGESAYGGRTLLNRYSIGIELDNAGVLDRVGTEFKAWFGNRYQANDVLEATHRNESVARYWHIFTEKQIESCRKVCELLLKKYGIKAILGHEEIAPGRKQDPGPAFPLDRFRDALLNANRSDIPDLIEKDGVVVADLLNIREGPGVEFGKVAKPITRGHDVKVIEEKDGWVKVETTISGWVGKAFIEIK